MSQARIMRTSPWRRWPPFPPRSPPHTGATGPTASPETKVVMLTGVASRTFRNRAREGGAALFIEKGTNIQEVVEAVAGVCGGSS